MDRILYPTPTHPIQDHYPIITIEEDTEDWVIAIEQVDYQEGYVLHLTFSDGHEQRVDFEPFLRQSTNPHIRRYLDQNLFQQFTLADGDLFWHDYDLCFPIADLYEGQVA